MSVQSYEGLLKLKAEIHGKLIDELKTKFPKAKLVGEEEYQETLRNILDSYVQKKKIDLIERLWLFKKVLNPVETMERSKGPSH